MKKNLVLLVVTMFLLVSNLFAGHNIICLGPEMFKTDERNILKCVSKILNGKGVRLDRQCFVKEINNIKIPGSAGILAIAVRTKNSKDDTISIVPLGNFLLRVCNNKEDQKLILREFIKQGYLPGMAYEEQLFLSRNKKIGEGWDINRRFLGDGYKVLQKDKKYKNKNIVSDDTMKFTDKQFKPLLLSFVGVHTPDFSFSKQLLCSKPFMKRFLEGVFRIYYLYYLGYFVDPVNHRSIFQNMVYECKNKDLQQYLKSIYKKYAFFMTYNAYDEVVKLKKTLSVKERKTKTFTGKFLVNFLDKHKFNVYLNRTCDLGKCTANIGSLAIHYSGTINIDKTYMITDINMPVSIGNQLNYLRKRMKVDTGVDLKVPFMIWCTKQWTGENEVTIKEVLETLLAFSTLQQNGKVNVIKKMGEEFLRLNFK